MTGSKTTSMTPDELREALAQGRSQTDPAKLRAGTPFVWDGVDEGERPLSREEMQAGVDARRRQRGRPAGSDKESTTLRIDRDILAAFRSEGAGWQTRMNAALREWLEAYRSTSSS